MTNRVPYEIAVQGPEGLHPPGVEHELRFTRTYGPGATSTDVLFLTTDELKMLSRVALDRLAQTVHVGARGEPEGNGKSLPWQEKAEAERRAQEARREWGL